MNSMNFDRQSQTQTMISRAIYDAAYHINENIFIVVSTRNSCRIIIEKIKNMLESSDFLLSTVDRMTETSIRFKNGSVIYIQTMVMYQKYPQGMQRYRVYSLS